MQKGTGPKQAVFSWRPRGF